MIVTATVISASASPARASFVNTVLITIRDSKPESKVTKRSARCLSFPPNLKEWDCAPEGAAFD
jgi:hypothetical protein